MPLPSQKKAQAVTSKLTSKKKKKPVKFKLIAIVSLLGCLLLAVDATIIGKCQRKNRGKVTEFPKTGSCSLCRFYLKCREHHQNRHTKVLLLEPVTFTPLPYNNLTAYLDDYTVHSAT